MRSFLSISIAIRRLLLPVSERGTLFTCAQPIRYATSTCFQIINEKSATPSHRILHSIATTAKASSSTNSDNNHNSNLLFPLTTKRNDDDLLDPYDVLRKLQNLPGEECCVPTIPFPTHFSPTSLEQFHKCPQAFFFQYILKLTPDPPMTPELARGILCHTALEEMFDLSPADRNLINLENLFRSAWKKVRGEREVTEQDILADNRSERKKENFLYQSLFLEQNGDEEKYDIESEIQWGKSSLRLLKNYFELENPSEQRPLMREMWVHARFPFDESKNDDFILRGKIDRIDSTSSEERVRLQIIDYKTGKKPWFKYSQSVNDRIFQDQFWKMKVYALMLWKMILQTDNDSPNLEELQEDVGQKDQFKYKLSWEIQQKLLDTMDNSQIDDRRWSKILEIHSLRLIHLTSHVDDPSVNSFPRSIDGKSSVGKATYLDYAIDAPSGLGSAILEETEREVRTIVHGVKKLVDAQSPLAFKHCAWGYCSCHEFRRRFRPGSVYTSSDDFQRQR